MVLYIIDASSAFTISPESVALQTAAIGSKISDIRNTAAEVTHAVGETIQGTVNVAVDTVNHASKTATAALNQGIYSAQHAVSGAKQAVSGVVKGVVDTTQGAVSGAVTATQQAVDSTVQTASNVLQTAANAVLTPIRRVSDHVSDKFVLISNKLYQVVHPNLNQEIVYVPVSHSTYSSPGVVVPANHHVTYTEVVQPSYLYKSGGVDENLVSGSENVENIVVPDVPSEGKNKLNLTSTLKRLTSGL